MASRRAAAVSERLRQPVDQITDTVDETADNLAEKAREVQGEYSRGEDRPLGGYLVLIFVYLSAVGVAAVLLRRRRAALPTSVSWGDLLLGALATHRVSRLLSKDPISSPLRAPFTRYAGLSGPAELREEVRSRGLGHAVGELLTCPFCLAQWVATALAVGGLIAPRATRVVAGVFATVGLADILHLAYDRLER